MVRHFVLICAAWPSSPSPRLSAQPRTLRPTGSLVNASVVDIANGDVRRVRRGARGGRIESVGTAPAPTGAGLSTWPALR